MAVPLDRRLVWIAPALALVAALVWASGVLRHQAPLQVTTAVVTQGAVVRHIVATGTLQATTTVQVGAQVSGTIAWLGADYNSIVHTHQVIARLDPALFAAAVDAAHGALQQAQATEAQAVASEGGLRTAVEDAQMKLTRAEALAVRQLIAPSDLDAARIAAGEAAADLQSGQAQVVQARAAVAQAKAALDQTKVNLDHTVIESPIDGIVVARSVDVGQTVASSMQAPVLFQIASDLTHMQVEVDIDEADIGGIQAGEPVSFEVESYPDEVFQGRIAVVRLQPVVEQTGTSTSGSSGTATTSPTTATTITTTTTTPTVASGSVITYATIVDVSNPDQKLRPGMTATVTLAGAQRGDVVRIPSSALSFRPPPALLPSPSPGSASTAAARTEGDAVRRQVWKYDGARFIPVDVRVGLADVEWTELVSGPLHVGDAVVTNAATPTVR